MADRLRPFVVDRNIRHFLWYGGVAGDGLRSDGDETPLIQERVLYPAHRHLQAGVLRGSGLYTVLGRAWWMDLPLARLSLCAPSALRGTVGGATMAIPGGASTTLRTVHTCCTHVPGSPASLIGSELPRTGLRPFTLPSVREVVASLGITPVL